MRKLESIPVLRSFLDDNYPNCEKVEEISNGGSERKYFRIYFHKAKSVLVTYSKVVEENESFFNIGNKLQHILPNSFPKILKINTERTVYSQTDFGDTNLLELNTIDGNFAYKIYRKVVKDLAVIQVNGSKTVAKSDFFDGSHFDKMLIYRDLFYFKNYFLDLFDIPYKQSDLLEDFQSLAKKILDTEYIYLMYRDFQGRNIMVYDGEPKYIDFQGSMIGPAAYDLVSILWQAKANLSSKTKEELYTLYTTEIGSILPKFDEGKFRKNYEYCIIIRILQTLGAYGKLGIIKKKKHFINSLEFGVRNLQKIQEEGLFRDFSTLENIAKKTNNIDLKTKL